MASQGWIEFQIQLFLSLHWNFKERQSCQQTARVPFGTRHALKFSGFCRSGTPIQAHVIVHEERGWVVGRVQHCNLGLWLFPCFDTEAVNGIMGRARGDVVLVGCPAPLTWASEVARRVFFGGARYRIRIIGVMKETNNFHATACEVFRAFTRVLFRTI